MADEEVVINLTIDARASAQRTINDLDAISSRLTKVAQETGKVSDAAARTNGNFSGLGRLTEKIANDLEPWGKAARAAAREFDTLTSKIEALKAKMSRSEGEDKILKDALMIVPQLKQRIDELKVSMLEASKAQSQFTSPEYLNRLSQAQTRLSAYGEALGRFKVQLDNSVVGMSSFANAQQMLANSASRMTAEFSSASSLMVSLTKEFNPGALAAQGMTEKMLRLSQAYKLGVVDAEGYAKGQRDIVNSFNVVSPAAEKLINDLKRLQIEQQKINQDRFKFAEQKAPSSSVSGHAADVKKQQDDLAKSVKDTADRFDYLTTRFNQDATAANNYRKTISELNEALAKGVITHRELGLETSKAIDKYNLSTVAGQKSSQSHKDLAGNINEVGTNARVAQYAMTNLSFQINDVVSGIAMGQMPLRIFAQQAGQFVQIFQQSPNVLSDTAKFIRSWITPMTAAVAGFAAIAVGVGLVVNEVLNAETRMRSFGVILRSMGTDGLTSAKALDEVVKKLRDTGSAASEAQAAVSVIARTPGINPQRVGDISNTARNISVARGVSFADAAGGLSNAIAGGAEDLTKYAIALGVKFNPAEQKAIELAILHRDKLEQLRVAYGAISRTMEGEYGRSLSESQKLTIAFTAQYHKLLEALGSEAIINESIKRMTRLGEIITAAIKGEVGFDIKFTFKFFSDLGVNIPVADIGNWLRDNVTPSADQAAKNKQTFESRRSLGAPVTATLPPSSIDPGILGEPGSTATILSNRFSDGVALKAASTANAQIEKLNGEFSRRLDAWLNALSSADRELIKITSGFATSGHADNSNHYRGTAVDIRGLTPSSKAAMNQFGIGVGVQHPGHAHVEPNEIGTAATTPAATRVAQSRSFVQQFGSGGGLTTPDISGNTKALTDQAAAANLSAQAIGLMGRDLAKAQAIITSTAEAERIFTGVTEEDIEAKKKWIATDVQTKLRDFDDQLNKGIRIQDLRTKGVEETTKAFEGGNSAMIEAAARAEANTRSIQEGIPFATAYRQILAEGAAEAAKSAAEQIASQVPILTGMQKQAEAAKISALAERNVRIENEANIVVQRALDAEKAKGNDIDAKGILILKEKARQQILNREASQFSLETTKFTNQQTDAQQVLQLQIQMQGQTTEEINRQVVLLTEKLRLERESAGMPDVEKQARLGALDATQRQVIALADATREQQRLESGIKSIADSINTTLLTSIENVFSGKKVESWRETVSKALTSLGKQLLDFTLIKPAIGTALGGLGFGNLSSQFGTFGTSLFGGSGSSSNNSGMFNQAGVGVFGSTSGSGSGGNIPIGDIASTGKGIFDLFGSSSSSGSSGGLFGGVSDFLFGGASTITDFGGGGALMGVADVLGPATVAEGLGTGGLLGGLGLSGLGSIIPFIGPALGIGSLLFGSLFQKKPANNSSGGAINLAEGAAIEGSFSQGVAGNTTSANNILKGISEFAQKLIKDTGGFLAGDLLIQSGTRDGIRVAGSIGNAGSPRGSIVSHEGFKFSSEAEAIEQTSLAMVRYIENTSETMTKVLDSITDLDDLDLGIEFANLYDSLKTAFDSAFSEIEEDKIGPYADALAEIDVLFVDMTESAKKFGLSLEPIDAGLIEANKRLVDDFNEHVSDAILKIEDPTESLLKLEREAGELRISDAIAIGADLAEVTRLNGLYIDEILKDTGDALSSVTDFNKDILDQILELTDPFKFLVQQEKELGEERLKDAIEIGANIVEVNRLNALKLDDIWDTQTQSLVELRDSLRSGDMSGGTIAAQIQAANDNVSQSLRLVRQGDLNEIDNLVSRGQTAFDLTQETYGNAPQTELLRQDLLSSIDDILLGRSFAGGSESTPEGWIRVGENGPEWMKQSGGNTILPSGQNPSNSELVSELKAVRMLLESGNVIARGVGIEIINTLGKTPKTKVQISEPIRRRV